MSDANRRASVASSDASAKNEMWLRFGRAPIRLVSSVDSCQHVRLLTVRNRPAHSEATDELSSLSKMFRSMIMDLV